MSKNIMLFPKNKEQHYKWNQTIYYLLHVSVKYKKTCLQGNAISWYPSLHFCKDVTSIFARTNLYIYIYTVGIMWGQLRVVLRCKYISIYLFLDHVYFNDPLPTDSDVSTTLHSIRATQITRWLLNKKYGFAWGLHGTRLHPRAS